MNKITDDQYNTFLADNQLDFIVRMEQQSIKVPLIDDSGFLIPGTEKEVKTGFCPVRTDTMQPLSNGGLSEGFKPIQNYEAFRVIPELANVVDLEMVKGNIWGNGAGVYAQISLGDMIIGNNNDKVGKYLSVINSHDGSQSMRVLITPYRFFCKNQIAPAIAHADVSTMISIRHTISASERIEQMISSMRIVNGIFEDTEEVYNQLLTRKVTIDHVDEVVRKLFPLAPEAGVRTVNNHKRQVEAVANRFQNADGGRVERDTAWNLYNAVQGTFQHDGRNTASKDKSILVGAIADKSATALSTVLELTSSQHVSANVMDEIDRLTM
jgi:phage/plasmid-like protein (TIGR03299 family)